MRSRGIIIIGMMIPILSARRTAAAHRVAQSNIPIQPITAGPSFRTVRTIAEPNTWISPAKNGIIAAALRPPALFANTANVPLSKNRQMNQAIISTGNLIAKRVYFTIILKMLRIPIA